MSDRNIGVQKRDLQLEFRRHRAIPAHCALRHGVRTEGVGAYFDRARVRPCSDYM